MTRVTTVAQSSTIEEEYDGDGVFCMPYTDALEIFNEWDISLLYPQNFFKSVIAGQFHVRRDDTIREILGTCTQFFLRVPPPPREGMDVIGQLVVQQEDFRWRQVDQEQAHVSLFVFQVDSKRPAVRA